MPALYRASLGYLFRHPWQLGLALLGICVGVAVMVAVDLANASSERAFLLSMETLNGRTTHQIVAGPAGVEESVYADLRTRVGLTNIAPVVTGEVSAGSVALGVLGVDLFAEQGFRSYSTVGAASVQGDGLSAVRDLLTVPGAVLMTRATATTLGVQAGDTFELVSAGRNFDGRVAGVIGNTSNEEQLRDLLITDIANAQDWFDTHGYLSRIDVRIDTPDGASRLQAELPAGVELLTAGSRTQTSRELTTAFMTNLSAMSLLAMLVGVFLIYNSVGFAVVQRRGLIGVLRALGVTREQTFKLIMIEGAVLGVAGAALGVGAGIWLGEKLLVLVSQSINDLYYRVSVTDVALSTFSIGKGALAGLGATLIAAAVPAWEAAGFQPSLALRRSALESRTGRVAPILMVVGGAVMAVSLLLLLVSGTSLVAGLTALFLLIFGFSLCIPVVVRSISGPLARVFGRMAGTPGRMAVDGIRASLSRTGVAIVALAVAVSATIGVSVMVDSFRLAVSEWLGNTLRSDLYVGVESGALDAGLIRDISAVSGIAEYSTSRRAWIESEGVRTRVIALSMASQSYAGTELVDVDAGTVWPAFDAGDGVVVSEPYAYRNQVASGDVVRLRTNEGVREWPILGVYRSYDANQGAVLIGRTAYDRYWSDDKVDSLGIYLTDGADPEQVMADIRAAAEGQQAIRMSSNQALRDLSLRIFDRTFVITDVLYWLAVGVAIIGILGAMLALQLEKARELAVLRALGMTPGQLGGMVTLQTSVIGFLSGLAAIPLGIVMAWVLIEVINRRAFGWSMALHVEPRILVSGVLLATFSALVAGAYPAWRAAVSSPAAAMREE